MTIRNLHTAFAPRSVALFGASERPGSPGAVTMANLLSGGFEGPIWPVNPKHARVAGLRCFADAAALPGAPELAVIASPPRSIPAIVSALGERGTRLGLVISGGLHREAKLERRILAAAEPHMFRLIGPGSSGLIVPALGLNAGLCPIMPRPGRLALVTQSGAIATALVAWAAERGLGFSHVASLGAMADVDIGDYLDLLAGDRRTAVVLAFSESIPAPRKFMSAARAAARLKPVIMVKAGRHPAGAAAASTHTGVLVGPDDATEAALRRAGVLRVRGLAELFDAAEILARFKPLGRARLGILTNAGGAGVLAVDRLADVEGELARLAPETLAALDRAMPGEWEGPNPLDIGGAAPAKRYVAGLRALGADPGVDVILAMNCPTGLGEPLKAAEAVAAAAAEPPVKGKPVLSCWLGGAEARTARARLREAGIASYGTPAAAAGAVGHLTSWGRAQAALLRVPDRNETALAIPELAREAVADVLARVAGEGRRLLLETEATAVLEAYGIPMVATLPAADPEAVAARARELLMSASAITLKLLSRDVIHKSEVGGVVLSLESAQTAAEVARSMIERLAWARPDVRIDGFVVQPMIRRPGAEEVIAGVGRDPVFGPVILFGTGGVHVEAVRDTAVALPPLDAALAADLVSHTRVGRLLAGAQEGAGAGLAALNRVLVALSHLVEDFPAIRGIDINPLLASADGVLGLDAGLEIEPRDIGLPGPNPYFAIRPYPAAWTRAVTLGGESYTFRAIRPADAYLYPDFLARLDEEAIRMRFLAPRRHFPDEMGLRLTQLDYDRDMAFVAIDAGGALAGVARMACTPDKERAEYALIVRSDLTGRGLGRALLAHLIAYARAEGVRRLEGAILAENRAMIGLVTRLGFSVAPDPDDASLVQSHLDL